MATITHTVTLIPSDYTGLTNLTTSSSYPVTRGYNNTSNSSFARFTLSTNSTGYLYYKFDTSEIPSSATITSVTAKARAYVNNTTRVTNTQCQLFSGTTSKGSNATFATTSTSNVVTLSPGSSWSRSDLNDLRIKIGATGSSSGSSKYVYFAGAEVSITYSVTTYSVTVSGDGTYSPSSATVAAGDNFTVQISDVTSPTVTDNNVDVTSQLVEIHESTVEGYPTTSTVSTFTATNINNAYSKADSDDYANLSLAGGSTGTIYLDITNINIPSGVTIKSVSAQVTLQFNRNGSTSGFTSSCRMYTGSTAKGSSTSWVSSGSSDVAKETLNLTIGDWTASEIANARFYLTATNSASRTVRYVYIYGVTFTVVYESSETVYEYTVSNIATDHTIVISSTAASGTLYYKANNSWHSIGSAYKKVNNVWVKQTNLSAVVDPNVNYTPSS